MIRHYVASAVRVLFKRKTESLIKIGGLTIGLAACILIALFVRDELSYDSWIPDSENIYRVEMSFRFPGREPLEYAVSSGPVAPAMAQDFAGKIGEIARIYYYSHLATVGDKRIRDTVSYADPGFAKLFPLTMVRGSIDDAFADNSSLIVSEAMATKYFGDEPALGQVITLDNEADFKIVGVFQDLPMNSHMTLDFLGLFDAARYEDQPWVADDWDSPNLYTYFEMKDGITPAGLESRFPDFLDRHAGDSAGTSDENKPSDVARMHLMALNDIHLHSFRPYDITPPGSLWIVYTFVGVALLILVIACINYVNLTTARATNRAPEIAMRKVMGAERKNLIVQFVSESAVLMLLALVLAVALTELVLPFYSEFLGKDIKLHLFSDPLLAVGLPGVAIIVGILSGIYPALYLASFRPSRILTANKSADGMSSLFRNSLVVLQFAVSIALIIATAVVFNQTRFARDMEMGYEPENRLLVSGLGANEARPIRDTLKQEVSKLPGVRATALGSHALPRWSNNRWSFRVPGTGASGAMIIDAMMVDDDYFDAYGMAHVSGRLFSQEFPADLLDFPEGAEGGDFSAGVVINESAVRKFGLGDPETAIGKRLLSGNPEAPFQIAYRVVGVVQDVQTHSLRFPRPPIVFMKRKTSWNHLVVELAPDAPRTTQASIESIWANLVPELPVTTSMVEDNIEALYGTEAKLAQILAIFAGLAVFVSALGLFGLSAFVAERRTREIGIRKVLGARSRDIIMLLVWNLTKPVIIANFIAWPVAWYLMRDWLNGFVYRLELSPLLFIVAGGGALLIAWLTVGAHAFRVSRTNPIHALRYE